jgi:hypothetical protein
MQRTTSNPILCNLCVEETRSYFREECERCGCITCNDCLSEYIFCVFKENWCYECYDIWFNRLSLTEKDELFEKLVDLGLMNMCEICGTSIDSNYIVCSSISCIREYEREISRLENNYSPNSVTNIINLDN